MAIAAIGDRSEGAVLERQQGGIGPFRRAHLVPRAGHCPYAARLAAGQIAHNVDMMRRLIEHDAAAAFRAQLFGAAWPIEEIGEIHRGEHAQGPERSAFDDFAGLDDWSVETMAVSDDHLHAGAPDR